MKTNQTLIGMPGAGKSTVGIILAQRLSSGFIDTDILIQINQQKKLQQIINENGLQSFMKVEEEELLKVNVENHVIATGGSAVYSARAMTHLRSISQIIFLQVDYENIVKRIHNMETRGIAKAEAQTLKELYDERQVLYARYADVTIDGNALEQEKIAAKIVQYLHR